MLTTVLIHSPFLGPSTLRPLAGALLARAHPVLLPDLRDGVINPPTITIAPNAPPEPPPARAVPRPTKPQVIKGVRQVFAERIREADVSGPLILCGHSAAGPLLPDLAAAINHEVAALILLDSSPPAPGTTWSSQAPTELVTQLTTAATENRLPAWNTWFSPDPLPELIDDPAVRARVATEIPRVPVSLLDEPRLDVPWPGRIGYLLLSPTLYGTEADRADQRGWPCRRVPTHHLASATTPHPIATAYLDLLTTLIPST